jgi:hypothetical protein
MHIYICCLCLLRRYAQSMRPHKEIAKCAQNTRCGVRFGIFRAYFGALGTQGHFEQQFCGIKGIVNGCYCRKAFLVEL